MMKRFTTFLISFLLIAACAPAPVTDAAPTSVPSATLAAPTETSLPPTFTPTVTPVPCDPLQADFCITDGHFIFQRPILSPGNDSVEATYRFGSTAGGAREAHHGVEFENASGTPIHAAADGEAVFAGPDAEAVYSPWKNFYGNMVVIRHAGDLYTLYAHLSVIDVTAGQSVRAGDQIGAVGKTGGAIGSHLHFEVRRGTVESYSSSVNPELWLVPKAGTGVLAISVRTMQGAFCRAKLTVQFGTLNYFIETYNEEIHPTTENAALGELQPGRYRIATTVSGQLYERWVDVEAGRLTEAVFVVK